MKMRKKRNKRLTAVIAMTAILLSVGRIGASADSTDGEPVGTQVTVGFADVPEGAWFAGDVERLTASGIINGYPDGLFHPEDDITTAEFAKLVICAVGSTDEGDISSQSEDESLVFPEHWASVYLTQAFERGILTKEELEVLDPDAPITRSAMTKMMILALGIESARIDDPFTDISDQYASTAYSEYLLRGYVLEDGNRVYRGSSNASRAEAATIIQRMLDYSSDPYSYRRDAILENASVNVLTCERELIDLFYVLNREFMTEFVFRTNVSTSVLRTSYERSNVLHLEYFYSSSASIKTAGDGSYRLALSYSPDIEQVKSYHVAALEKAREIASSIITDGMSDADKVKAIHDYLILNCKYDYDNYQTGNISYESRLAYGALVDGNAVCQGYCAAFSLLSELAGLRTLVVAGQAPNSPDTHAWNAVLLDGQIHYLDITHDDPVPDRTGKVSYRFYLLSEIEMASYGYVWDRASTNLKYFY